MLLPSKQKLLIKMVAEGLTIDEIAIKWKMSRRTIDRELNLMRARHDAKNLYHLLAIFFRKSLIK